MMRLTFRVPPAWRRDYLAMWQRGARGWVRFACECGGSGGGGGLSDTTNQTKHGDTERRRKQKKAV